jgi:regulator of sirC expression with transglutaminase-like and TPR domain
MNAALEAFAAEVRHVDAELDLGRAALLIAAGEYPTLSIDTNVALLDEIGAGIAATVPLGAPPRDIAQAVRRRLFHDLEFKGNDDDYYDPRNSYLNDVLLRRRGIPITLSVVFLEVGRRAGLEAVGVSYPSHFLVKYVDDGREWIVDPFHGGEELSGEHFRAHLRTRESTPAQAIEYFLAGVTRRQILARMLANLKAIYAQRQDHERALRIQDYTLALTPWSFEEIRDRGLLRERTGDPAGALQDLETYLEHAGEAKDIAVIRQRVERLRAGRRP